MALKLVSGADLRRKKICRTSPARLTGSPGPEKSKKSEQIREIWLFRGPGAPGLAPAHAPRVRGRIDCPTSVGGGPIGLWVPEGSLA